MTEKFAAEDNVPEAPSPVPPWAVCHTREEAAWIVLHYEWHGYQTTYDILRGDVRLLFGQHVVNALIESMCLHARNLCALLIGDQHLRNAVDLHDLIPFLEDRKPFQEQQTALMNACGGFGCWYTEGRNAWILRVMAEPTAYRQESYDIGPVLEVIDPPLRAMCEALETWRQGKESLPTYREQLTKDIYRDGDSTHE